MIASDSSVAVPLANTYLAAVGCGDVFWPYRKTHYRERGHSERVGPEPLVAATNQRRISLSRRRDPSLVARRSVLHVVDPLRVTASKATFAVLRFFVCRTSVGVWSADPEQVRESGVPNLFGAFPPSQPARCDANFHGTTPRHDGAMPIFTEQRFAEMVQG